MNVNLGPVFDRFVTQMLKSGLYQSQSEVLREALRLLKEREDLRNLHVTRLRSEIAIGAREADLSQFVDGPGAFDDIRRRLARRKPAKR